MQISDFVVGNKYTSHDIQSGFKSGFTSGMLSAPKTHSLVLISNHEPKVGLKSNPYEDKWIDGILHYTGRGQNGDQTLTRENEILANSPDSDITVYLFEVFKKPNYIYRGVVTLIDLPYTVEEYDLSGHGRMVYKFPLKLEADSYISVNDVMEKEIEESQKIRRQDISEVEKTAKRVSRINAEYEKNHKEHNVSRKVTSNKYDRDPAITRYVKSLANGVCALCEQNAPFLDKNGEPYLHAHHIEYLVNGGVDTIENVVAVCPNCHEKIHILEHEADKEKLQDVVSNRSLKPS